ncbi:MAG: prolyl oligopeptidase family serine peptidase [Planctomycetes bacterium]|nr:prolyl oligopeptidase family serine peptidase [Planctomycetota bacterium]
MTLTKRYSLPVIVLAASITARADVPKTAVRPVKENLHGIEFLDSYRWLEALESESDEVKNWTTQQNAYTRRVLDSLPGRAQLEARFGELMSVGTIGLPDMRQSDYFYLERKGTDSQPKLYVRQGSFDAHPRLLLDPTLLDRGSSEAEGLYSIDWHDASQGGDLVAFALSYAGDEMSVLHILQTSDGEWLADEIPGKVRFAGWLPDDSGFFYSRLEKPEDPYSRAIRFHRIGRHHSQDELLFSQREPSEIPGAYVTNDGRWLFVWLFKGWSKQDLFVIDASAWARNGTFEMRPIAEGLDARFRIAGVLGDTAYLFTTLDAPNGQLYTVDLNHPERSSWNLIVAERPDAVMEDTHLARGVMAIEYTKDATSMIERRRLDGTLIAELALPGIGAANLVTNDDRTEAFLRYTSFNEPSTIFRVDLESGERALWARPKVRVDPQMAAVQQLYATSKDGTKVPVFVVHKKGLKTTGNNPCLLVGYGGFNISLTPRFRSTTFPWLERGGVYAVANLRGGGEYGEVWHRDGMLENKQNVFDDFYAVAEHLIKEGYTRADRLACWGGSNGGLLTGAAVTQRPDLFAAAISAVPLLDMLRYHKFLMARFWIPEYGSSEDPEQFRWLRSYSPYHHVEKGKKYPAMLITAGENDNRVHPLHARKMTALMQAHAANDPVNDPILLSVNRDAGHGSGKPLRLRIRDTTDQWGFVMWQTGMLDRGGLGR